MKAASKILSAVVSALLAVIIAGSVSLIVAEQMGYSQYIVMSGSMEPVIHTGAVAFINTNDTDVEVGDIVTYRLGDEDMYAIVTHRITAYDEKTDTYITMGDANDTEDFSQISKDQIIGTYAFSIPLLGYLMSSFITTKITVFGFSIPAAVVILAALLVLLDVLSSLFFSFSDDGAEDEEIPEDDKDDFEYFEDDDFPETTDITWM